MVPDVESPPRLVARQLLSKVPEVTLYFWIIKVLSTTVGETFADFVNTRLGAGLYATTAIFAVLLAAVFAVQFRLREYVPAVYWTVVVLVSIVGTLFTDSLTDATGVPLIASTLLFSALLAAVFGVWYAREHTLSIHSIVTRPREAFYWLAVLVTFALGTAAGDWTLQVTGFGPGVAALIPLGLIAAIAAAWRLGASSVLCFWLAFILTRPLGANLGDYLGLDHGQGGLGLGKGMISLVFLVAIAGLVAYLSFAHTDRIQPAPDEQDREAVA